MLLNKFYTPLLGLVNMSSHSSSGIVPPTNYSELLGVLVILTGLRCHMEPKGSQYYMPLGFFSR